MQRLVLALIVAGSILVGTVATTVAHEEAPMAACNQGTMNAHSRVPERAGKAHDNIPEHEDGMCLHEAHERE